MEVCNLRRDDIVPHIARVWSYSCQPAGSVLLAPCLAHNLGLALHVIALLESSELNTRSNSYRLVKFRKYHGIKKRTGENSVDDGTSLLDEDQLSQSIPSSELDGGIHVHVASNIKIKVIREPAHDPLAVYLSSTKRTSDRQDSDGADGQTDLKSVSTINGENEDVIASIKSFLIENLRVVSRRDILTTTRFVRKETQMLLGSIFSSEIPLSGAESEREGINKLFSQELVHFMIEEINPSNLNFAAIDVKITMVEITGTCSVATPVGVHGYYLGLSGENMKKNLVGIFPTTCSMQQDAYLPFVGKLCPHWWRLALMLAPALHPDVPNLPWKMSLLIHGPSGCGKKTAISASAAALGCHIVWLSANDIVVHNNEGQSSESLKAAFEAASKYRPVFLVLDKIHDLGSSGTNDAGNGIFSAHVGAILSECVSNYFKSSMETMGNLPAGPLIFMGCTTDIDAVPARIRRCFTHEFSISAPNKQERECLLRGFMKSAGENLDDKDWETMARHTAGLLSKDLEILAADACAAAAVTAHTSESIVNNLLNVLENKGKSKMETSANRLCLEHDEKISLEQCHITTALEAARERMATDIGAPRIPDVRWGDVGGLDNVKDHILDTIELPLRHPELFANGLRRRSGVLLYGPPGTGKTLIAKAVATECAINFLSVKGPELINMYVGESERLVRDVFERARRARPCVIFFDELDSLAPARGRGSDSGGIMDRVVSQLLAEIDSAQGGSGTDDVFIIGATNRPDLLDPALLRPGRIDKLLYVGVANSLESRLDVLQALTCKFVLGKDVHLEEIAKLLPAYLTGADLYALCSDAWMIALKEIIKTSSTDSVDRGKNIASMVVVHQQQFLKAAKSIQPSLTKEEVENYEAIRDQYEHGKK